MIFFDIHETYLFMSPLIKISLKRLLIKISFQLYKGHEPEPTQVCKAFTKEVNKVILCFVWLSFSCLISFRIRFLVVYIIRFCISMFSLTFIFTYFLLFVSYHVSFICILLYIILSYLSLISFYLYHIMPVTWSEIHETVLPLFIDDLQLFAKN